MPEESRRAFGADRLETGKGGEIWLVCASPKSWLPRQDRTLTRAEYPGTAVDWEGRVFEVLRAEPLADGGMRYRLAPWEEGHAIRRMEQYDETSEAARATESDDRRDRVRRRRFSILLAPLLGLLPGAVQKTMESEFGAPALAMTISSAFPLLVIGFLGLFRFMLAGFGGELGLPVLLAPPFPLALYLFGESALRLGSAFAAGAPMGSLPIVLAYEAWRESRTPRPNAPGPVCPVSDAERDALDRFRMLEPSLALLTPSEQQLLARRFGFEPVRWGKITTAVLLLVAGGNAAVSLINLASGAFGTADALWLPIGGLLTFEQIRRWRRLKADLPAGSVLGALVRPLAKPLLGTARAGV
jgi:hypothetical protein